jgi:hypothetical protein
VKGRSKSTRHRAAARKRPARPSRSRTHTASRSRQRKASSAPAKHSKFATVVSRARATTPARSAHATAARLRTHVVPSPLPLKHVAPPRPVLVAPARSMPPMRDTRKPALAPARGPLIAPDFAEAGIILAITYSIRDGRRGEFFDLMRELKPLLLTIGGSDVTIYEDRSRPNYFMEVFRFKDDAEFTAFDDKFHKDRKIAAIYALLDDIVEAEKSDFKIFERRL